MDSLDSETDKLFMLGEELDTQYEQLKELGTEKYGLDRDIFERYELLSQDSNTCSDKLVTSETSQIGEVQIKDDSAIKVPKPKKPRNRKRRERASKLMADKYSSSGNLDVSVQQDSQGNLTVTPLNVGSPSKFCLCKSEKLEDMIGCDAPNCKGEWFHYSCVGLSGPPGQNEKWFCPTCTINFENKLNNARSF